MSTESPSEERFRRLVEVAPDTVLLHAGGKLLFVNPAGVRLLGAASAQELVGQPIADFVDPGDATMIEATGETPLTDHDRGGSAGAGAAVIESTLRRLDGERIEVEIVCLPSSFEGRSAAQLVIRDVTRRKRAEAALRSSEERFRSLVQNAADMISILDADARIIYWSPASQRILGVTLADHPGSHGFELIHPQDRPRVQMIFDQLLDTPGESLRAEYRMRHADGSWRTLESSMTHLLHNPAVAGVVVNSRDVTDRKRAEARLLHDALHDALTALPNRTLFMDRLAHCLDVRSRLASYRCAVLFLDLDRFKMVNDSLGHAFGDRLLIEAGTRLAGSLRPNDTLARLGGDEFAILLDDVRDAAHAVRVAQRIQTELETPFSLEGREIYSAASIGIALSDADSGPEDVLRDADTAMYRAKSQGRAGYAIFDADMHAQVRAQLRLETDLRRAVAGGQLEVFYQPIVDLRSGTVAGFEALARWHHPARGLVLPSEFMPLAEETGLVTALGRTLMTEACAQMKAWNDRRSPQEPLFICVNLSRRQLHQPDLLDQIEQMLAATGLPGDRLAIEVAESGVADRPDAVLETLVRLRRLGVRASLDNFGTGTASLSLLHRFPFDRVKIDRWFVHGLGTDGASEALIAGILTLCHGRRLDTVAAGVETAEQRYHLRELGCDYAQGFLFSEPVAKARAEQLLAAARLSFEADDAETE